MEKYEPVKIEVTRFETEDIITTSNNNNFLDGRPTSVTPGGGN